MNMPKSCTVSFILIVLFARTAMAGPDDFRAGTVIKNYGRTATVESAAPLPNNITFKVVFDVAKAAKPGELNRQIESAARLLNMHAAAGAKAGSTKVAIVVHGGAAMDLVNDERYGDRNANADLIEALNEAGVEIYLCGQTAVYRDITAKDILPGVKMRLSAMTAHALLQQKGYTLNPF